jgi:hypothetical protein
MDMYQASHENHQNWLAQRQKLESMENKNDEHIIVPSPQDIIMGRHWEAQLHRGNVRFRDIIAKHWEAYDKGKKSEKTMIARGVVQAITSSGSRFLKSDGCRYVIADDMAAREKVSSSFRDRRKALNLEEKRRVDDFEAQTERLVLAQFSCDLVSEGDDFVESKRMKWS